MTIIDGLSRSASVVADEITEVLAIKGKDFLSILNKNPVILFHLLKVLSGRVRRLDGHVKRLSLTNSIGKVASVLLSVADYSGVKKRQSVEIKQFPTLQNIANMANVSRSTVSRALSVFDKSGETNRKGKSFVVKNYDEFKNMYC